MDGFCGDEDKVYKCSFNEKVQVRFGGEKEDDKDEEGEDDSSVEETCFCDHVHFFLKE